MNLLKTKKLHYGRYLYKVAFRNKLAGHFRTELQKDGLYGHLRQKLDELHSVYVPGTEQIIIPWTARSRYYDTIPVEDYFDSIDLYRLLVKAKDVDFLIRCEIFNLNFYSNDRDFITKVINLARTRHIEFWEPDPEDIKLLNAQENIIIVKEPPQYEYKITLGKEKGSPSLAKWIDANPQLGKMGQIAKQECARKGYVKGYYFFVRDEKALLIAQMMVGSNIQRIDRLVCNR